MDFFTKNNEVASFYAGLVDSTFHLDVKQELQDCMVKDQDLVDVWDSAITSLSTGETTEWRGHVEKVFARSLNDFEGCNSAKLRTVGTQLNHWWGSFWSQGAKADELVEERTTENWLELKKQALALRFNWEIHSYYDAGKRLGNFWTIEIGAPKWVDELDYYPVSNQIEEQELEQEPYPLAEFFGSYFEELYQEAHYDELAECLVPDELHMRAHDLYFLSLDPYDHFAFQRYFAAIWTLNEFNFEPCSDKVVELLVRQQDKYDTFWSSEDAEDQAAANSTKYLEEFDQAISTLQQSWHHADPRVTGKAYAQYQKMLLEQPEKKTEVSIEKTE